MTEKWGVSSLVSTAATDPHPPYQKLGSPLKLVLCTDPPFAPLVLISNRHEFLFSEPELKQNGKTNKYLRRIFCLQNFDYSNKS